MLARMSGMERSMKTDSACLDATVVCLPKVEALMLRLIDERGGGSLAPMAREHLESGGKRLRARLALAATAALGGAMPDAVAWAAAAELLHNATLVHDDLQDGDRLRRGRPTVWDRHGVAQAINVGDLLFLLPFAALAEVPTTAAIRGLLMNVVTTCGTAVIAGQAAELVQTARLDTSRDSYRRTAAAKTSGLFELPVRGAALIGGSTEEAAVSIARPFAELGVLFQIQDDILDLYAIKGREAPGADIREGKVSALVVEHLRVVPGDREWLAAILKKPRGDTTESDVVDCTQRFRDSGALAAVCRGLTSEVAALTGRPSANSAVRALLAELCERMLTPIQRILEENR